MNSFKPAVRQQLKGRIAIDGPSGSGKTFTAMRLATALANGGRIAVVNTESGAVQKYLGLKPDGIEWQFDICELDSFSPSAYTEAIIEAGKAGYDVLVIDSLSHAWEGEGGALEMVTNASARNKFTAWKDVTPMHNKMIGAILRSPCHVVVTMRSKVEYILEDDGKGKQVPRKVGMAPVQRSGMEYEFDLYCSMDWDHVLRVSKSRCPDLDGVVSVKPSSNTFGPLVSWLNDGSKPPEGYYSANADDYKKYEQQQIEEIKQKPLSALEQAKAINEAKEEVKALQETHIEPGEGQSLEGRNSASINEPCSQDQVDAIKAALTIASQVDPKIRAKIKDKLAKHGFEKIAELNIAEADALKQAIETNAIKKFFELELVGVVPF